MCTATACASSSVDNLLYCVRRTSEPALHSIHIGQQLQVIDQRALTERRPLPRRRRESLAHSKNELTQCRGVRRLSVRLSVCPSVNFCANRIFSQANGRIATKLAHDGLRVSVHPGCAQGQGQVKGHVIRALSWILGMSYSVIDGLFFLQLLSFLRIYYRPRLIDYRPTLGLTYTTGY